MGKPIAIYLGVDTGGSGSCNTQPAPLTSNTSLKSTVFADKIAVIKAGDVLTPVVGVTPPIPVPVPCQSQRVAISTSKKVFVNKKLVALQLDILNAENNIKIAKGSTRTFAN